MSVNVKSFYIGVFVAASLFAVTSSVSAGTEHNLSGFGWSGTIGWISFNSIDCDTDGNGIMSSTEASAHAGCPAAGSSVSNYGATLDLSGNISGYIWAETIGWISFDRAETGNPPNSDINSGTGSIAKVNFGSGAVNGWARALSPVSGSNFWDGWIHLSGTNHSSPDATGGGGVTYKASDTTLIGYAWGSDIVGWINFNVTYDVVEYVVTVTKSGSGAISAPGLTCGVFTCTGTYAAGSLVTFTASPDPFSGYTFAGWSGACETAEEECTISVEAAANLEAHFASASQILSKGPAGSQPVGTTDVDLTVTTDRVSTCKYDTADVSYTSMAYTFGSTLDTTHTENISGLSNGDFRSYFVRCKDATPEAQDSIATLLPYIPDIRNAYANDPAEQIEFYIDVPSYTLTVVVVGGGTVSGTGGISCEPNCTQVYLENDQVVLTPHPTSGSVFSSWTGTGACSGTGSCTVSMTSDKNVTANFSSASSQSQQKPPNCLAGYRVRASSQAFVYATPESTSLSVTPVPSPNPQSSITLGVVVSMPLNPTFNFDENVWFCYVNFDRGADGWVKQDLIRIRPTNLYQEG